MKRASVVSLLFSIAATTLAADFSAIRSSPASWRFSKRIDVGRRAHEAGIDQLIDELVAQALDVHGPAAGEMQERLLALGGTEEAPRAARDGLVREPGDRRAAFGDNASATQTGSPPRAAST